MSFVVNKSMCKTCIFGGNSPISQDRFKELKGEWESKGKQQECHQASIKNEHIACRGHYEAAKRSEVSNYPAVSVMNTVFQENWDAETALQIGERMGLIIFRSIK